MSYQKHNFEAGAILFASQLNDMDNQIEFLSNQGSSFSDDFKTALLNCFENVAWINENGQTYYDVLYDSLYPDNMWFITNALTDCVTSNNATSILKNNSYVATITANQGYTLDGATVSITMGGNDVTNLYYSSGSINIPNVTGDLVITVLASSAVVSITAVFTQGSAVIYDTDTLNTLKQYLTVTATYADSTTATVTNYTLSGTLTAGTSTITASYGGKTDTFSVTVTATPFEYGVYTPDSVITGGYIDNTGTFVPSGTSSGYIEDYIPVVRSSYLICYNNAPFTIPSKTTSAIYSNANWRVTEYDANKEFIKQTQFAGTVDGVTVNTHFASRIVTFDSATRFIRLGWYDVLNSAIAVFDIENPESVVNMLMESGDINSTTGADATENKRIRSDGYIPASNTITVTGCPFGSSWSAWAQYSLYGIRCYDSNYSFVGIVSGIPNSPATDITSVSLPANTAYIRFVMQYGNYPFTNFKWLVNHLFTVNGDKYYIVGE